MDNKELPGVLFVRAPRATALPLVFDSPHSGTAYSDDFHHIAPRAQMRLSEDSFIDELYAAAPDYGAALNGALFPRIYVDPNRSALDIDPALLDEAWPGDSDPGPKCDLGVGLIWRLCPPGDPVYDRKLAVAEVIPRLADKDPFDGAPRPARAGAARGAMPPRRPVSLDRSLRRGSLVVGYTTARTAPDERPRETGHMSLYQRALV